MKNRINLSQLYESCKKWKTLVLLGAMLLIGINTAWADVKVYVTGIIYSNDWVSGSEVRINYNSSYGWSYGPQSMTKLDYTYKGYPIYEYTISTVSGIGVQFTHYINGERQGSGVTTTGTGDWHDPGSDYNDKLFIGNDTWIDFCCDMTVYWANTNNFSGTVYAYAWGNGENKSWSGAEMTNTDQTYQGHAIYSITLDNPPYPNIIFNVDGAYDKKTADLTLRTDQVGKMYLGKNGGWTDYTPDVATSWDLYNSSTNLGTFTQDDEYEYSLTVNMSTSYASLQFKKDGSEGYIVGAGDPTSANQTLSISGGYFSWANIAGVTNGTYVLTIKSDNSGSSWYYRASQVVQVNYDANGATSGSAPAGGSYASGDYVNTASSNSMSKEYYTFDGWNTEPDGTGTHYNASTSNAFQITSSVTLYAEWEPVLPPNNTLEIHGPLFVGHFDGNWACDRGFPMTLTTNDSYKQVYTFSAIAPKGDNQEFVFKIPDGSGGCSDFLKAKFNLIDTTYSHCSLSSSGHEWYNFRVTTTTIGLFTITVTFRKDNHAEVSSKIKVDVSFVPTEEGYYLKHPWGANSTTNWRWKHLTHESGTLYTLRERYGNNGCNYCADNTAHNNTGWNDSPTTHYDSSLSAGDSCLFVYNSSNNNIDIYKLYSVTFNVNGATSGRAPGAAADITNGTIKFPYSRATTVPSNAGNLAKSGYNFVGWNTANNGTGDDFTPGISTLSYDGRVTTLYAKWEEVIVPTITSATLVKSTIGNTETFGVTVNYANIASGSYYRIIAGAGGEYTNASGVLNQSISGTGTSNFVSQSPTITGTVYVKLYNSSNTLLQTYEVGTLTVVTTHAITVASNNNSYGTVSPTTVYAGSGYASASFTATNESHYHFVNWTKSSENFTLNNANSATTYITTASGGGTVTANFAGDEYAITYKDKNNVAYSGSNEASLPSTHTYGTATVLVDGVKPGYIFGGWFTDASCTNSAGASIGATAKTADFTLYTTWTEDTKTLVPTVNSYGTAAGYSAGATNSGTIGVVTTTTLTCDAATLGYSFVNWTLTNLTVTSGSATSTSVTVKITDPSLAISAVANYAEDPSCPYRIKGGTAIAGGEGWDRELVMRKRPGHTTESIAYDTITLSGATPDGAQTSYNFKIVEKGESDVYWGIHTDNDNGDWWYYRSHGTKEMTTNGGEHNNIQLRADMAGDYIVKVDYTDAEHPTVEIIFPINGNYDVTLRAGSHGSVENPGSLTIHQQPKVAISATAEAGYRFVNWTVDSDHSSYISFDNANSASTNVWATNAAAADATITANFTNEGFVYLDKTGIQSLWPGDVYVYFYDGTYWNDDAGSGSMNIHFPANNAAAWTYKMSRIPNTQIFYFDYTSAGVSKTSDVISFTDSPKAGSNNFDECSAIYTTAFQTSNQMFVVEDYKAYKNKHNDKQTCYYNEGYWMKYNNTSAGLTLELFDQGDHSIASVPFTTTTAGNREFTASYSLSGGTEYRFKISGNNGSWYGCDATMDPTHCSAYNFYWRVNNKCVFTSTGAGSYKFTLVCADDGKLKVSLEFPLANNDYRVVYHGKVNKDRAASDHPSDFIRNLSNGGRERDTISFYVTGDWSLELEKCADASKNPVDWDPACGSNVWTASALGLSGKEGVYVFEVRQNSGSGCDGVTISPISENNGLYDGDYYIRSTAVGGGWEAYKNTLSSRMIYSNYSRQHSGFDYYNCVYKPKDTNVKFTIANDYSSCISDTLDNDTYVTYYGNLPGDASVRFMYNSATNVISRAYLNGSSTTDFLLLEAKNDSIKELNGDPISKDGNLLHHIKFRDMGNWIYQKEVQALEGTHIRLTSNYRFNNTDHVQHFKGQPGEWTGANIEQLIGGTTGSFQRLRLVYDFKTNHLTAAWLPPSSAIEDAKSITADMLLIRHAQEAAQQITFSGGSIADVKTIVGAIEFRESEIVGNVGAFNNTTDAYKLLMYYISFPFDVAINDIYGFGQLNKEWYLQYYDGADRAERGFFGGDGTTTFWKFMNLSDTLKANVGYSLLLDNDYFNTTGEGTVWNNTLSDSIYLYFPSVKEMSSKTIIASGSANLTLPEHTCPHDRGFTDLSGREVNHMFTDSHWNMMGVPLFQNQTDLSASFNDVDTYPTDFENNKGYFFEWDTINNVFVVASANDYVFKSMHGYMVQYAGNVSFSGSSMQPVPAAVAARRLPSQEQYQIDLQMLRNNERVSRTFVELRENACDTFALNEDMYMITNSRPANLYTFAGNYDVSANVLSVNNHIVEVGTIVRNAGTYRFTMPSEFSGSVVLIDTYTGARTNLALGDYEVNLERGTINDRFLLEINIHNAPTAIEGIEGGSLKDGKAHKFVQNGVMYILRDGKLFDARGAKIK